MQHGNHESYFFILEKKKQNPTDASPNPFIYPFLGILIFFREISCLSSTSTKTDTHRFLVLYHSSTANNTNTKTSTHSKAFALTMHFGPEIGTGIIKTTKRFSWLMLRQILLLWKSRTTKM